ncbi:MAG: hypothetical protein K0R43_3620, partial [Pseudoduganella sp.]|nr:hypothetical protein [Pseudoduganella sp.]
MSNQFLSPKGVRTIEQTLAYDEFLRCNVVPLGYRKYNDMLDRLTQDTRLLRLTTCAPLVVECVR